MEKLKKKITCGLSWAEEVEKEEREEEQRALAAAGRAYAKLDPFGSARPREVVLEEKGVDWRKFDRELDNYAILRREMKMKEHNHSPNVYNCVGENLRRSRSSGVYILDKRQKQDMNALDSPLRYPPKNVDALEDEMCYRRRASITAHDLRSNFPTDDADRETNFLHFNPRVERHRSVFSRNVENEMGHARAYEQTEFRRQIRSARTIGAEFRRGDNAYNGEYVEGGAKERYMQAMLPSVRSSSREIATQRDNFRGISVHWSTKSTFGANYHAPKIHQDSCGSRNRHQKLRNRNLNNSANRSKKREIFSATKPSPHKQRRRKNIRNLMFVEVRAS